MLKKIERVHRMPRCMLLWFWDCRLFRFVATPFRTWLPDALRNMTIFQKFQITITFLIFELEGSFWYRFSSICKIYPTAKLNGPYYDIQNLVLGTYC